MILICLFIIITVLGFIFIRSNISEGVELIGWIIGALGLLCLIIALPIVILAHVFSNHIIQTNNIEYEGLCRKYEIVKSEYEDVSKSDVISDITAWNMYVYNTKYWSENPWTNCFNPKKIADNLNYILLEEESEEQE
jgi:hypothetical protein